MEFSKIYNSTLDETLYTAKHESGLSVYVLPKKGFTKTYAAMATNYGSIDTKFKDADGEIVKIPDGMAHFMEHKLFEQPDGTNSFDAFNKTGASANAYTSFCVTNYLFSSTDKFYENLEILLDYVTKPYFTDENIAKEQGIIGQEIKMYDDDPNWRVFFNTLIAMYVNHPVKIDIAGTVESISHINKDIMYKGYNTFYHPSNMILFICGNAETDEVSKLVDKYVKASPKEEIERIYPQEPEYVNKKEIEQSLSVSIPLFNIAFKDSDVGYDGMKLLKKELVTSILLEMLFGDASDIYNELYDKGLINDSFGADYEGEKDYAFSSVGGESPSPYEVRDVILSRLKETVLNEEDFKRAKRVEQGNYLRLYNSVENLSNTMVSYLFKNINMFDFPKVFEEITFEDVKKRFDEHFKAENCVISVIKPYEG